MTETSQHATAYMCRQWRPATAYTKDAKSHCLLLAPGLHETISVAAKKCDSHFDDDDADDDNDDDDDEIDDTKNFSAAQKFSKN